MRFSCDGLFQKSFVEMPEGEICSKYLATWKKLLRIIFTLIGDQTKESKVHNIS